MENGQSEKRPKEENELEGLTRWLLTDLYLGGAGDGDGDDFQDK